MSSPCLRVPILLFNPESTRPGLQVGQYLYSGQGHDQVRNQTTSSNVLSIPPEIHALGSSHSRKSSTVAHPPAPLQPGQLLRGQLLYSQPPQRTVTHASAGPKCNHLSQYVRKGAGKGGGVHFLQESGFVWASLRTDGLGGTAQPQPETHAEPAVLGFTSCHRSCCGQDLLFPFLSSFFCFLSFFFLFNNPGCIFSLNQTICLLAFISSNKDSEDPEPMGSRHFLWRLQEALRKKLRALE